MGNRLRYQVHKWLAITVGGFFLVWLVSGILMIMPPLFSAPALNNTSEPLDRRENIISPIEAVETLENSQSPEQLKVDAVTLKRIVGTPVYEVAISGGDTQMINARSGEQFTIDGHVAEQIIRSHFPSSSMKTELVTRHNIAYPWGPIPAFRIELNGDPATQYYVSTRDGEIRRSDRWTRIQGAISSLHTFEPIKLIVRGERVRKALLILSGAVGIAAALSGYYLAIPRRRRKAAIGVGSGQVN